MRALLINPPLVPAGSVQPPLGLATLASWLVHVGHHVRICDLDLFHSQARARAPEEGYIEIERFIEGFDPDVVGVTSMYSNSLQAARIIKVAKDVRPDIVTVAGGSHFGALPLEALNSISKLDFVVCGEGELGLAELLKQVGGDKDWSQVPSLAYRNNGNVIINAAAPLINLQNSPSTWTTLGSIIDLASYASTERIDRAHKIAYIEAGRGCPFECTFCASAPFWRRRFRVRPVARIIEDIRTFIEYGYDRFVLVHDLLTANRDFISELCDGLLMSKMPVEWMGNSRVDIPLDGLLPKMKASGCWKLFFGVESASNRVQHQCNKHLNADQALQVVQDLASHGLTATCSFVAGFPDESRDELGSSLRLGARLKIAGAETVQFHRLRLWPPAPLAAQITDVEFDRDSLAIEYPFIEIEGDDITTIESQPSFFGGYFVPNSNAGSRMEIAQFEMFAQHAIAIAPMTILALDQYTCGHTVDVFYTTLRMLGPLHRERLDWEGGNLLRNWQEIRPYLDFMIDALDVSVEARTIAKSFLSYEDHRVQFISYGAAIIGISSPFICDVNIPEALHQISSKSLLDDSIIAPCTIAFERSAEGYYQAFAGPADAVRFFDAPP
jgi:radical SAM superfamily enzyme YgiQ (UPF0313 family)